MAEVTFLDTSGLAAKYVKKDPLHQSTNAVFDRLVAGRIAFLTTSLVLVELGDYFSAVTDRHTGLTIRDLLLASERVEVVQTSAEHEAAAWRLFASRQDKSWGMTDCVSFGVMEERGVQDAYTADRHFAQAGFHPLLVSA